MGLTADAERRTSLREQEVKKSLDLTTLVTCASWWVEEGGALAYYPSFSFSFEKERVGAETQ